MSRARLWIAPLLLMSSMSCMNKKDQPAEAPMPEVPVVEVDGGAAAPAQSRQPGAEPVDAALRKRLEAALAAKGAAYVPRTEHLDADKRPIYLNRLILENSPYLLQHAHNPVDWYPWGEEAFEVARRLNRPVLLSVGYATCHWCHVMERESFEDVEIATFINSHFIAVKVDRERRPDVDSLYMKSVRVLSGGNGGWPMTVAMTPAREPFFAGTYFPARDGDRGARKGFLTILKDLSEAFSTDPAGTLALAAQASAQIKRMSAPARPAAIPGGRAIYEGAAALAQSFDPVDGGFGRRPKFPRPASMGLLLQYHRRSGDPKALGMVALTLKKMADGGIYDHVGGGFHRYSVDNRWLVPHFEKMLYDNAQLAALYLETWQLTGDPELLRVLREILAYVAREMTGPEGAFYSAADADSLTPSGHQEEGWFFTWTPAEIDAALSPEEARAVKATYNVTAPGNFEGRNILNRTRDLQDIARELSIGREALDGLLASARSKLYDVRARRPWPLTDDKILVEWNGLMISAFARAGLALGEPALTARAARAADFLLKTMIVDGALFRVYRDGKVSHKAVLDDHAFLAAGLLDLFEATGEVRWLKQAVALHELLDKGFFDAADGGFFLSHVDTPDLMVREKPDYDGAVPAGNSVAAQNLLRLHALTDEDRYRTQAEKTLSAFGRTLALGMTAAPRLGSALDFYLDQPWQIVLVKPSASADASAFLKALGGAYVPNRVLIVTQEGEALKALQEVVPLVEGKVAAGGEVTAYVCQERVCKKPTGDPAVFLKQLAEVRAYEGGPFEALAPPSGP